MSFSRIKIAAILVVVAGIVGGILSSCAKHETLVAQGNRTGTLYVGNGGEVQYLDPHIAGGSIDNNVLGALYEGLVTIDEETGKARPGMAERWEISPDGKTYTFYLRKNAVWSNGEPLTVKDFLFSFRRALAPKLASEYKDIYYPVVGAEAYGKGQADNFDAVGFRALDGFTLEIKLNQPTPYFLQLLRNNAWFPVYEPAIDKANAFDDRSGVWTKAMPYVTNGPFTLQDWKEHQHIIVVKNPLYWDAAKVRLNEIVFSPSESVQNQDFAYRADQLHTTWDVPLSKIDVYKKELPKELHIEPSDESFFVRFNVNRAPFTDVRVRQAFAMSIDRESIVRNILRGSQLAASALTPPNLGGYVAPPGLATNYEEARRLLGEAGFPGGKNFPTVEFLTIPNETNQRIAETLQDRWRKELGVNITILQKEFKMYLAAINDTSRDYTFSRGRWTAEYPDPLSFLSIFTTGNGVNGTGWTSLKYDDMIAHANAQLDPARRNGELQKAEAFLLQQTPIAPVYWGTRTTLIKTSVHGWKNSPMSFHNYKDVWLEP